MLKKVVYNKFINRTIVLSPSDRNLCLIIHLKVRKTCKHITIRNCIQGYLFYLYDCCHPNNCFPASQYILIVLNILDCHMIKQRKNRDMLFH
jgi:hypothetical protein